MTQNGIARYSCSNYSSAASAGYFSPQRQLLITQRGFGAVYWLQAPKRAQIMSSTCHGSSGEQDPAKHKRKAGPSKAQTGDFVLLDQVYLLETIFTMTERGIITRMCVREGS